MDKTVELALVVSMWVWVSQAQRAKSSITGPLLLAADCTVTGNLGNAIEFPDGEDEGKLGGSSAQLPPRPRTRAAR